MTMPIDFNKQSGAALVIGLLLLVVITVLAVSGMSTATTELAMARNDQSYENAFQAAETGLEAALAQSRFDALEPVVLPELTINEHDSVLAEIRPDSDPTIVPDRAFSLGVGSGVVAYHFVAVANAVSRRSPDTETDRDSSAEHTQAFYIIGPQGPAYITEPQEPAP